MQGRGDGVMAQGLMTENSVEKHTESRYILKGEPKGFPDWSCEGCGDITLTYRAWVADRVKEPFTELRKTENVGLGEDEELHFRRVRFKGLSDTPVGMWNRRTVFNIESREKVGM